jgi:hypothetical protein
MKNLSFKEWLELKEAIGGQVTPAEQIATKKLTDKIEIEKLMAQKNSPNIPPDALDKAIAPKVTQSPEAKNFINAKVTAATKAAAAAEAKKQKPATGVNPTTTAATAF